MKGITALIGYCIATAISLTAVHLTEADLPPPAVTLATFAIAAAFFLAVTARQLPQTVRAVRANPRGVLALNATTAATWLTGFWAVKYLAPDLFLAIFMGVAPLTAWVLERKPARALPKALLVTATVAVLVIEYAARAGLSAPGLALAIVSGVSASAYLVASRRMTPLGPAQILSVRFFLLIALSLIATAATCDLGDTLARLPLGQILFIAVASAILPLYLLQLAIARMGAARVANALPFTCVTTYVAALVILHAPFDAAILATVIVLCGTISYAAQTR